MPMWRCPHCGTPQAETARCWVCRRSSTACVTCRHFRRSVAANVGYCGLDRDRIPLTGDEIRACWEANALPMAPTISAAIPPDGAQPAPRLEFIEVRPDPRRPARAKRVIDTPAPVAVPDEPRWSLWED